MQAKRPALLLASAKAPAFAPFRRGKAIVLVLVLGTTAFCAGKDPDGLLLFCSVSLIVKRSDS